MEIPYLVHPWDRSRGNPPIVLLQRFYMAMDEVGTDEAGRGCLAGPVTAAAVILPPDFRDKGLNDSKQLTEAKRRILRHTIEDNALHFAVCHVMPSEIDQINILNASITAMHRAIAQLPVNPSFIVVDGNRFHPFGEVPHACIIKGDGKYMGIAAASILAKTYRDEYMEHLHETYPMYQWIRNKGYPTKAHRNAIREFGLTEHHRRSFRQLPDQLALAL